MLGEFSRYTINLTHNITVIQVITGKQKDISSQLSSLVDQTVERNCHILNAIIDVVVFCDKQKIALRGRTEVKSNFMVLLQFHTKTDPILESYLKSAAGRSKYTSPQIQNELIDICASLL